MDGAGTQVLEDSGWVSGSSIPPYTFAYALTNNTSYQVRFTCRNTTGSGIDSLPATQGFTTSFTPVGAPTGVSAIASAADASVVLTWTAPTGTITAIGYRVERSLDAGATWSPAATVTSTTWTDYGAVAGLAIRYRVVALGDNGTTATSATVTATPTWEGWRFTPDGAPASSLSWVEWAAPIELDQDRTEVQGRAPFTITARGPRKQRRIQLQAKILANGTDTPEAQVSRLFDLAGACTLGWLRGPEGTTLYGEIHTPRYDPQRGWAGDYAQASVQFVQRQAPY